MDTDPIPVWDLDVSSLPSNIVSGTWKLGWPKACPSGAPSHKELNKDAPNSSEGKIVVDSGPLKGKSLFDLAFDTAVWASIKQFERLMQATAHLALDRPTSKQPLTQDLFAQILVTLAEQGEQLRLQ